MLTVTSLSYAFAARPLFAGVSFGVGPGDVLHLQGANGVGKSTLLSVLAGLRAPTAGQIECRLPGAATPLADRRFFFSYLSAEANGLYLKMDAKDNLAFWAALRGHKPSEAVITETLNRWGLGHRILRDHVPVGRFSTGMRRRLALARVSLAGAPCWLLDEPVYGLDTKGISLLQELLSAHKAAGGMAIIVSHAEGVLAEQTNLSFALAPA